MLFYKHLKNVQFSRILVALFVICVLAACQSYTQRAGRDTEMQIANPPLLTKVERPRDLLHINSLLVAPYEYDDRARDMHGLAADSYRQLTEIANDEVGVPVFGLKDLSAITRVARGPERTKALLNAARKFGADGILLVNMLEYVERDGSQVGANESAQVDFSMEVLQVSGEHRVWESSYHFRDQALSENLFRIKERFGNKQNPGWKSAKELLVEGLRQGCKDFAQKRSEQFVK